MVSFTHVKELHPGVDRRNVRNSAFARSLPSFSPLSPTLNQVFISFDSFLSLLFASGSFHMLRNPIIILALFLVLVPVIGILN